MESNHQSYDKWGWVMIHFGHRDGYDIYVTAAHMEDGSSLLACEAPVSWVLPDFIPEAAHTITLLEVPSVLMKAIIIQLISGYTEHRTNSGS